MATTTNTHWIDWLSSNRLESNAIYCNFEHRFIYSKINSHSEFIQQNKHCFWNCIRFWLVKYSKQSFLFVWMWCEVFFFFFRIFPLVQFNTQYNKLNCWHFEKAVDRAYLFGIYSDLSEAPKFTERRNHQIKLNGSFVC